MSALGLTASLLRTLALSRPNTHSASNRRVRVRRCYTRAAATFSPLRTDDDRIAEIPHLQSDHLRVQLFETVIDIAGHPVKLVLPESEDVIVDMYAALGRPDDDPHWATLWQGSVALAEEVLCNPELVRGKRVIDLGTGLGLAGIAAGLAGASEVVLTDREPRTLHCALCAAALNGLSVVPLPPSIVNADPDGVPLPELLTFHGAASDSDSEVKAAILDWFNPDFRALGGVGFDVVLACDVLYTEAAVDVIAPLAIRLFDGNGARDDKTDALFVLADPPGRFPQNHARFLSLMENMSLSEDELGESKGRRRAVRVDSRTRNCVNLVDEPMTVELSTYVIEE